MGYAMNRIVLTILAIEAKNNAAGTRIKCIKPYKDLLDF